MIGSLLSPPESGVMNRSKGFTIAELAVATAILALLLFGAMIPFSTQVELRNIGETQRTMDTIKEAILGFAQANGRLPCPANGTTQSGTVDSSTWPTPVAAGAEQWDPVNTRCYIAIGVVPWTTLGISETDAWGRRLTYRVSPAFADAISLNTWQTMQSANFGNNPSLYIDGAASWQPPAPPPPQNPPFLKSPADQVPTCPLSVGVAPPHTLTPTPLLSSFALCSLGDIAVFTRTTSQGVPLAAAVPAVFISHGKNGYGAWQSSGTQIVGPPAGTDEAANITNGGNPKATPTGGYLSWVYYSRSQTAANSGCVDPAPPATSGAPLCGFDDIVVMIPLNTLMTRMVAAGKLP
jgi:type II secretory pathway pseudopilin PulG